MDWIQAFLMGMIQGLTEFLPVSSSGHLTILNNLFGIDAESNLTFAIVVHAATALSTICVLWKEIWSLLVGFFKFKMNEETIYVLKIVVSMIPIAIIGLFFKDYVEEIFGSGLFVVGICLLLTAILLSFAQYAKVRKYDTISYKNAFIIGVAQSIAVLPGLSRSGSTIAAGLLLGNKKESVAKFSFLMVIVPILGEALLDLIGGDFSSSVNLDFLPMLVGFLSAFFFGYMACRWMINIVKKGKLIWFALYCAVVGVTILICSYLNIIS